MTRFSPADLDDIRARHPLADIAGQYVKLRRAGARLVGPCPVCGGRAASQRFEILPDGAGWVCAVCNDGGDVIRLVEKADNCDFLAAVARLGGQATADPAETRRLLDGRETKRLAREKTAAKFREAERKRLYEAWRSALPLRGTPAARYLEGRGIVLPPVCPGLGYLPRAPYFHGEDIDLRGRSMPRMIHQGPALLAAFIRADGTFGGLHTTFLDDADPPRKLALKDGQTGEPLPAKKMRGSKTGAHIAVSPLIENPSCLVIGEGIETVLSVLTAMHGAGRDILNTAFCAAGDLGNLAGRAIETVAHPTLKRPDGRAQRVPGPMPDPDDAGLSIPEQVAELILLGDGDSDEVLTWHAMERAARRYTREGREIRIVMAPAGMDFNDLMRGEQ